MTTNRGFIKWIIIIVIALLVLSYYGFSLRSLVDAPVTQDNIHYVATTTVSFWDKYLKRPASYVWNDVFIDLIWEPAIDNLTKIKNSEPTNVQTNAPKLPNPVPLPN
ncbi:MAG: hypothetical protein V4524_03750 [Patescibacteria group bacterium]